MLEMYYKQHWLEKSTEQIESLLDTLRDGQPCADQAQWEELCSRLQVRLNCN